MGPNIPVHEATTMALIIVTILQETRLYIIVVRGDVSYRRPPWCMKTALVGCVVSQSGQVDCWDDHESPNSAAMVQHRDPIKILQKMECARIVEMDQW